MEKHSFLSFYGWKIIAASVIILAIGLGMYVSAASLFVIPVSHDFGVSRAQFTFHRTIVTLAGAASMIVYGKAIKRVGVKAIMITGAVMNGLITIGNSFALNLWQFYVLAFFNGLFMHALGFLVIGVLVSDWFTDKKGLATGIAFAGSGLGGAVMIPIINQIMELTDWRFAYRFMGALGIAVLLPVILLIIKKKPEQIGLMPYTLPDSNEKAKKAAENPAFDLSFEEARKTGRFWLILASFFLITTFAAATNTHTAPFITDLGYPVIIISAIVSLFMIALTVGKIILGFVYDRFGVTAGNGVIITCAFIFPIAALFSDIPPFPWIYALTLGMASCGVSVPVSILMVRHFGQKDFPVMFSYLTMITTLGAAASIPAMGAVFDNTGSYNIAWFVFFALAALITIFMISAEALYKKKKESGEQSRKP